MTVKLDKKFPVIEVFGPTIQGEGAMAGRPTHFIRMAACDYRCDWCDTDIAVLPEKIRVERKLMTVTEIFKEVVRLKTGPKWVTLSGGNPALQDLTQLVNTLQSFGFKVAVETQGTKWQDWLGLVDQLTISPKPPSSLMCNPEHFAEFYLAYNDYMIDNLDRNPSHRHCIKVPVHDEKDYEYAINLHLAYPDAPFYFSLVTEMGGLYGTFAGGAIDNRDSILDRYRWLAERISTDPRASDVVAIPQLHALLWGHGRGF